MSLVALAALCLAPPASPAVGDRWPAFELKAREGEPYRWRPGRTTVLSFCAFWCDTWKDQLPRVREAASTTQGLPVDFATISVDGRWTERARAAAAGRMLGDPGGAWTASLGIDRVPSTFVIAPDGRVVWTSAGTVRTAALVDAIRAGIARRPIAAGRVFLTFDDFPGDRLSHELLDVLRAENVRATLFCIGSKAAAGADVLRRAAREGHTLGVHSWSHSGENPELARCAEAILRASGQTPELYRPPGSERILTLGGRVLGLPVDDPYDYTRPGQAELLRRVLAAARPNAVIQLHAGVADTVAALPAILQNLRTRGYTFETLSVNGSPASSGTPPK